MCYIRTCMGLNDQLKYLYIYCIYILFSIVTYYVRYSVSDQINTFK